MAEDNEKISEEETMATKNLPGDLIEFILSRLPVKYLLRFRAAVKLDLPFNSPDYTTEVVGSCNGLLCISSYGLTWYHKDDIFLWNPSTRRYKKLPFTPIECPIQFRIAHLIGYGFGYDPITDDYKLVRVVQSYGRDDSSWHSEVKVYSLSTNSWRRIRNMPFHLGTRLIGVHANSALHWVADRFKRPFSSPTIVVSFDLKDEEYREVPLPDFVDLKFCMTIGFLGGQLVLCNFLGVHFEVWLLKDYGVRDSWTKQFLIEGQSSMRSLKFVRPICYSKNGEVILKKISNALVLCDPCSRRARNFRILSVSDMVEAEFYVGSLVPLVSKMKLSEEKEQEATNRKRKRI
ncbi:F-box protein CPR1-like [Macadamia integrifolia]|uniref:F-box protein CPR1-like n=1 Tax=Macadamia integrifolia TaxID=60698 RepID=UPI001C4E9163|nr:F-box protein CPR1-like [Macadamia integrifolia]